MNNQQPTRTILGHNMRRIPVTELWPGDIVKHSRGLRTVSSVIIRNGFSGVLSVRVEWRDSGLGQTYGPSAKVWAYRA